METETIFQIISVVLLIVSLACFFILVKASRIFITKATLQTPGIGQYWPEYEGVYAGIASQENGEDGDGHIILLDIDYQNKLLTYLAAIKWAKGWGKGSRLPSQAEAALLYANVRSHIKNEAHWTSTQISMDIAIVQDFQDGFQFENNTKCEISARAIRRIPVTHLSPTELLKLSLKLSVSNLFA